MKLHLFNDNILITELQDDIITNGVITKYDPDSPYMFCEVQQISDDAKQNNINEGDILVIKRYAKEEYLPGSYFISFKDVRGSISRDDYNKLIG